MSLVGCMAIYTLTLLWCYCFVLCFQQNYMCVNVNDANTSLEHLGDAECGVSQVVSRGDQAAALKAALN